MLTLYYTRGACSMAAHIVLEESGEAYATTHVDLTRNEQRSDAFLAINPLGRIPALVLDDGTPLAENTAILPYLGKRCGLWPSDSIAEAKALSIIGLFASSVHPAYIHARRPERYSADPVAVPSIREAGRKSFIGYLNQIDVMLARRDWLLDRYSVLDPYALVFYACGHRFSGLEMTDFKNFTAFRNRMLLRPAVRRVVDDEKVRI